MSTTAVELESQTTTDRNLYGNLKTKSSEAQSSNQLHRATFPDKSDQNNIGGIFSGVEGSLSERGSISEEPASGFKLGVVYEDEDLDSDPDSGLGSDSGPESDSNSNEERKLKAEEQQPRAEEQELRAINQKDWPLFIDQRDDSTSQSMNSGTKKSNKRKEIETIETSDGNQNSLKIHNPRKLKVQKKDSREKNGPKNINWEEILKAEERIAAARKEGEMQSIIKPDPRIPHFQSPLLTRTLSKSWSSLQDLAGSFSSNVQNKVRVKYSTR